MASTPPSPLITMLAPRWVLTDSCHFFCSRPSICNSSCLIQHRINIERWGGRGRGEDCRNAVNIETWGGEGGICNVVRLTSKVKLVGSSWKVNSETVIILWMHQASEIFFVPGGTPEFCFSSHGSILCFRSGRDRRHGQSGHTTFDDCETGPEDEQKTSHCAGSAANNR